MFYKRFLVTILCLRSLCLVTGDGTDWVDVDYLIHQRTSLDTNTADARAGLIRAAGITARDGPWSVQTPRNQLPPSNNPNDYMSFAPYYWPDCSWCSSKREITVDDAQLLDLVSPTDVALPGVSYHPRISKTKRFQENILAIPSPTTFANDSPMVDSADIMPAVDPFSSAGTTTSSENIVTGTLDPAQAHAKTESSKCTPSPATAMAPSATWTSCPYKNKDGQANPDTRNMAGPNGMNDMSQAVLYNALSYAVTGTESYSKQAVSFIDAFFLNKVTAMTPNVNYGQIVRGIGPEHQLGTFTGILDLRGMVKVVNAILALKNANSSDWDDKREAAMVVWTKSYIQWLETNTIAIKTSKSANNHATFFYAQLTAVKILAGDLDGARDALNHYFGNQFRDQIAASGEQPFEAVRTKPYHYRCFNLEAMITAAKLGDYLGMDFWTIKTKNGVTIQKAVDFTMQTSPGSEPVENIFPHVAAAAAAYGDPDAKYAAFLKAHKSDYKTDRFWLYDQTSALKMAPAVARKRELSSQPWRRRSGRWMRRGELKTPSDASDDSTESPGQNQTVSDKQITFQCPAVFEDEVKVELDNGVFTTCDQLKPYYDVLLYPDEIKPQ